MRFRKKVVTLRYCSWFRRARAYPFGAAARRKLGRPTAVQIGCICVAPRVHVAGCGRRGGRWLDGVAVLPGERAEQAAQFKAEDPEVGVGVGSRCRPAGFKAGRGVASGPEIADLI